MSHEPFYFTLLCFWALIVLVSLLSMGGSERLICVPKMNKGLTGLELTRGWLINDRIFIFGCTIHLIKYMLHREKKTSEMLWTYMSLYFLVSFHWSNLLRHLEHLIYSISYCTRPADWTWAAESRYNRSIHTRLLYPVGMSSEHFIVGKIQCNSSLKKSLTRPIRTGLKSQRSCGSYYITPPPHVKLIPPE